MKSEIEKVWQDWEEKCGDLEEQNKKLEFKANESEMRNRELNKSIHSLKREGKEYREISEQARSELRII